MRRAFLFAWSFLLLVPPASAQQCCGDCDGDGQVTIAELISAVNSALGRCAARFMDNGDGSITDLQTNLMWEKKDDGGGVQDKDNTYSWSGRQGSGDANGTLFTVFLPELNNCTSQPAGSGFAGHCDWRLPSVDELAGLYQSRGDSARPWAFDENCTSGCTVQSCSCTVVDEYWSSTTDDGEPLNAWVVSGAGERASVEKNSLRAARAVRDLAPRAQ